MLTSHSGFTPFVDYDLDSTLRSYREQIKNQINSDRALLLSDEDEYISNLLRGCTIPPLIVNTENISVSQKEIDIPARYFPYSYDVERGRSYPKPVVTFHVPFVGDEKWLHCRPSSFMLSGSKEISTTTEVIQFEVINFNNDADSLIKSRDEFLSNFLQQVANVNEDINRHNLQIEQLIREAVKNAKNKFKAQDDLLSKLGKPLK